MDISKISTAIDSMGYNPFGIQGTKDADAQKFAQQNGISVEEAKSILKEAEQKVNEQQQNNPFQSAMLDYLSQPDEEEEIVIVDDADFDNFLNEESPEQKMQELLAQQGTFNMGNNQQQGGSNPFLKFLHN